MRPSSPQCIKELESGKRGNVGLGCTWNSESAVFCRGYIQHWLKSGELVQCQSIKSGYLRRDKILKGRSGELQEAVAACRNALGASAVGARAVLMRQGATRGTGR